jgi:hypothetical protein
MSVHCVILVGLLVTPPLPTGGEKPRFRARNPPHLCLATANEKDGTVHLRISVSVIHPYEITKQVPISVELPTQDGEKKRYGTKWEKRTETAFKSLMEEADVVADGEEVKVSRKNGHAVHPRDLPKLLSKETPVLVFAQGEIDPYYLQVIQDHVLIIVIPANKEFPGRTKADK